ncbi:MAG: type II toxin-antitoxin system Phd/YefM family antitoxin [Pseudonocardia sp.]
MVEVGVHEAKSPLSELLRRVAAGEEVTITSSGEPVAKLVPVPRRGPRSFGRDRGLFEIPADFDAPLPDDRAHPVRLPGQGRRGRR